jgi:hypothetical protein
MSDRDAKPAPALVGNEHAPDSASTPTPTCGNNERASTTNKRMKQQGSASNRLASSAKVNCFKLLDGDSRLKIFSCLSWQDLGRASATSKAFRRYCRHRCLTQNADRQRVLHVGDSADQFLALLASAAALNQFATYSKLKIVRGVKLEDFSSESVRHSRDHLPRAVVRLFVPQRDRSSGQIAFDPARLCTGSLGGDGRVLSQPPPPHRIGRTRHGAGTTSRCGNVSPARDHHVSPADVLGPAVGALRSRATATGHLHGRLHISDRRCRRLCSR